MVAVVIAVFVVILIAANSRPTRTATPQTPAPTAPVATGPSLADLMVAGPLGEKTLGNLKAPNTVIEYGALMCDACVVSHVNDFAQFKKKYLDTGKLYYIFRQVSLDTSIESSAIFLTFCSKDYFSALNLLFQTRTQWSQGADGSTLNKIMGAQGFNQATIKACFANQQVIAGVNWIRSRAVNTLGVKTVPAFFLNGQRLLSVRRLADFDSFLGG